MASVRIIAAAAVIIGFGIFLKTSNAFPAPDSAGIVEMVKGLAYGGIPYGSVSGMLKNPISHNQEMYYAHNNIQEASLFTPNARSHSQDVLQLIGPTNSIGY